MQSRDVLSTSAGDERLDHQAIIRPRARWRRSALGTFCRGRPGPPARRLGPASPPISRGILGRPSVPRQHFDPS
jgi:hypothetical protein